MHIKGQKGISRSCPFCSLQELRTQSVRSASIEFLLDNAASFGSRYFLQSPQLPV